MTLLAILSDGFFAAVAAVGFGAVSDPPMRAFPAIALLAAVGHALRFCLMNCAGMDIATASLCAATAIGFGSLWLGKAIRCPMTALYIPALLPMVPGIYAYKTVFSLIMFLQSLDRAEAIRKDFTRNGKTVQSKFITNFKNELNKIFMEFMSESGTLSKSFPKSGQE